MSEPINNSPIPRQTPEVLSFRAVLVMTQNDGLRPTLESLAAALQTAGLKFVMPADPGGIVVISVNDHQ
jgi:hypothetical protein